MSAPRKFELTSVRRADVGPSQSAMEIRCGSCGATDHIVNAGGMKVIPPTALRNKWQAKGWRVGAGPADDRCPACLAAAADRKVKGRILPDLTALGSTATDPVAKDDPMSDSTRPDAAPAAAEAPTLRVVEPAPVREMTRDDRRIILSKLQDVYIDEEVGYDRGWSDKRVAEDLGVPRAWVAELREPNFGPARDNEDIRALLAAQERVMEEAVAIKQATAALVDRAKVLAGQVEALRKTADTIRKAVC